MFGIGISGFNTNENYKYYKCKLDIKNSGSTKEK